jgi:hypothetical protein
MASGYPGALDTFATTRAGSALVGPDVLDHADAINKIEAELGINPSSTYATVTARLAAIEAAGGGGGSSLYFDVTSATYGATGDGSTNDTTAIQAAINAANAAGGGVVYFPAGTYICNVLTLYANITLAGDGDGSILKQPTGVADGNHLLNANAGTGGTADPAANMKGIVIRDLVLQGRADTDTFTEQVHLINMNAVSDVLIFNVKFVNFRGDGIYLGSGNTGTIERHNENVTIIGCTFDGTTSLRNNRNGISIIDGTNVRILFNHFQSHTTYNMPGAIDLEPNPSTAAFARIRGVIIAHNTFFNIGGMAGVVSFYGQYGQSTMTYGVTNIQIVNNTFKDCDNLLQVWIYNPEQAAQTTEDHGVLIQGNDFSLGGKISTATITVASPGVITTAINHDLQVNDQVYLGTTGALPTGLAADTRYYVVATPSATTLRVSATRGGTAINTSGTQSGTHTLYRQRHTQGVELDGARGVRMLGNRMRNFSTIAVAIGYTYKSYDVRLSGNSFYDNGSVNGRLIYLFRAQYAYFVDNTIDNSIYIEVFRFDNDAGNGATDHIYATHNHIIGSGLVFSTKAAGHVTTAATNIAHVNDGPAITADWTAG